MNSDEKMICIVENGQVRTKNSNKPHGLGPINPATFTPFPKNPAIARVFGQMGWADELGSGLRRLMKFGKVYGSADPELIAGDVLRIVVQYPEFLQVVARAAGEAQVESAIFRFYANTPQSSREIVTALEPKKLSGNLRKTLPRLRDEGLLEYTIPEKSISRQQQYRLTERGPQLLKSQVK